ncbi:MAG: dTDP-4-keto-6-deoxy-D-glucose epimerase, partial [Mesorhizobium sp.]
MLEIIQLGLDGLVEIVPKRFHDARGYFVEDWNAQRFAEAGIDLRFVQDNRSYSAAAGVVRGLHYQLPPHAQEKLV